MEQAQRGCAQTIAATYAACDSLIGRVRDAMAPADILMVISECGAGPLSAGVRLNTWLQREGFLARSHRGSSPTARLATAARRLAPKVIPRSAFHAVNRLPLKAWVQGRISDDGIDWSRTSAFHRGKGEGNIYINLLGRDRHGVVAPCDYDGVRQDIIDRLARLRDPATDSPAVAAVHRREDLFEGPHADGAPDIVVEWKNFAYMPAESGDADGPLFGPRVREYMDWPTSGSHRRQGFLMAHGEGLRQGPLRQAVDLRDLAPTWVELLGGRAPGAMHGRSRAPDFLTQTPATPTQAT
jgi:predicted AlkP superfamily phosphohydrolase/phosphomutase